MDLVSQPHGGGRSSVMVRGREVGSHTFTLIAGVCAVESREQLRDACDAAVAGGASMLRGDLFKHRTSPYAFQGLGREGLDLIAEERARCNLPWVAGLLHPADLEPP